MTDDLVKRLHWHRDFIGTNPWPDGYPFLREVRDRLGDAADRIEALTAERDALGQDNHRWKMECENFWRDREKALTAERDRLREALDGLLTSVEHADFEDGWCCCGDDMLHHQSPMDCGHTPVDMGEYHASLAIKKARAALKGETP